MSTLPSHQKLAQMMLEARTEGYTVRLFLKRNILRYAGISLYFAASLAFLGFTQLWTVFWIVLGMVAGCFLRDISWARAILKTWPFTERVTDWDAVQGIAEGTRQ